MDPDLHKALRLKAAETERPYSTLVKTLVLSHLVPPDDPTITEQMWIDAARPHFKGEIIVARDLMET